MSVRAANPTNQRGLSTGWDRRSVLWAAWLVLIVGCAAWNSRPADAAVRHQYLFNDGTANDSVGSAHGTLMGGATVSLGQVAFNGAGAFVDLPAATIGINGYSAATFEAWFTNNNTAAWQRVFDFGNTSGTVCANCLFFSPSIGGTGFRGSISNSNPGFNNEANATGAGNLPINTQHYIAVTLDDTSISLYHNGALVQSTPYTNAGMTATLGAPSLAQVDGTLAYLGRALYTADPYLNGSINQFTIHDTALSAAQIQANFTTGPTGPKGPTLRINRDTGAVTFVNEQAPVNIVGYTITSAAGAFDQAGWRPIANFYDADSGGSFDGDDRWTVLSAEGSDVDLSEFEFDGGMGGVLGSGGTTSLQLSTGGLWRKSIYEDVQMQVRLADGTSLPVAFEYVGNNNEAFRRSDLNFDGQINVNDWNILLANNGSNMNTLTDAESYARGDLNGDQLSNYTDFRLFKADFNAANGAGAFEALTNVPEPATVTLFVLGCAAAVNRRNRRLRTPPTFRSAGNNTLTQAKVPRFHLLLTTSAAAIALLISSISEAALKNRYSFTSNVNDSVGTAHGTVVDAGTAPNFAFTGGMLDLSANAGQGSNAITEDAYVDLPNGLMSSAVSSGTAGAVTFEFWATVATQRTWQRFGDFGTSDTGEDTAPGGANAQYVLITPNSGRFGNGLEITNHPASNLAEPNVGQAGPFPLGTEQHVVAVYDHTNSSGGANPNGTMTLYLNGSLIGSNAIHPDVDLAMPIDNNNWLGRSQWPDPVFDGSYNEFRVYDHALSADEVGKSFFFGPDEVLTGDVFSLEVNSSTGQVQLINEINRAINFDYYEITSAGGALNTTGWNSLDDKEGGDPSGQGWDESGGANANQLIELFLGDTPYSIPANGSLSLGNAFNVGGAQDLAFRFGLSDGAGIFLSGSVEYVAGPGGVAGDYNQNGLVDAADFVVWRNSVGSGTLPNRGTGITGNVGQADYDFWRSRFGANSGSGAGGELAAAVPEPATLAVLACCMIAFATWHFRNRSISVPRPVPVRDRERGSMRDFTRTFMALVLAATIASNLSAGTPDRTYRFGDDMAEAAAVGATPNAPNIGPLTLDSQVFNTVGFTDASDLSFTGGPTYFNTGSGALARPGAVAGTFGLQFNGTSDVLFRADRGLGVPAQADDNYALGANNAPGYANITTRYIEGWVRPTGGAGTQRDVINDTARFGIFIGADNNWGFRNGTTTVNSSTAAPLNTWSHVMHRTFGAGGGAVLLVDGIAVAATPNGYATGGQPAADLPIVFGAGLNQSSNFFAGQLDDFALGVAGNNTGQPGGRDYGAFNLATDNAFVRQNLVGVNAGDINRDGSVNSGDVDIFVPNWRRVQQINGVTVGDLNSRLFGDLNMNGTVDIDDAYTLHFALRSAGVGAGLDFGLLGLNIPEPGSMYLVLFGIASLSLARRHRKVG